MLRIVLICLGVLTLATIFTINAYAESEACKRAKFVRNDVYKNTGLNRTSGDINAAAASKCQLELVKGRDYRKCHDEQVRQITNAKEVADDLVASHCR